MASQEDATMKDGDSPTHQPFTVEENIEQLISLDKAIVELMGYTVTALDALTIPVDPASPDPSSESPPRPVLDPEAKKEAFRSATDAFLKTLHHIDAKAKRQIYALEEAGIVNLTNPQRQDPNGPVKPSLKPNGVGAVGNLDVGWLNSRGTRVERDMEAELWGKAKEFLEEKGENLRLS